jgi:hypothetical protein
MKMSTTGRQGQAPHAARAVLRTNEDAVVALPLLLVTTVSRIPFYQQAGTSIVPLVLMMIDSLHLALALPLPMPTTIQDTATAATVPIQTEALVLEIKMAQRKRRNSTAAALPVVVPVVKPVASKMIMPIGIIMNMTTSPPIPQCLITTTLCSIEDFEEGMRLHRKHTGAVLLTLAPAVALGQATPLLPALIPALALAVALDPALMLPLPPTLAPAPAPAAGRAPAWPPDSALMVALVVDSELALMLTPTLVSVALVVLQALTSVVPALPPLPLVLLLVQTRTALLLPNLPLLPTTLVLPLQAPPPQPAVAAPPKPLTIAKAPALPGAVGPLRPAFPGWEMVLLQRMSVYLLVGPGTS